MNVVKAAQPSREPVLGFEEVFEGSLPHRLDRGILAELFRRKLIGRGPTDMAIGENLADQDLVTDAGKALLANASAPKPS